jgi:hypothetical protein
MVLGREKPFPRLSESAAKRTSPPVTDEEFNRLSKNMAPKKALKSRAFPDVVI